MSRTSRDGRDQPAKILLVEDDAPVRAAVRRALLLDGHEVFDAQSSEDAMLLWQRHAGAFDCVVSDVVMPGMRGPEMVALLRKDRPDLPVLFMSGYVDRSHRELVLDAPFTLFLQKPFDPNQLAAAIAELRRGNDGSNDGS